MPLYRIKTPIVEAFKYRKELAKEIAKWCGGNQTDDGILVRTLEGKELARWGDYIVKTKHGHIEVWAPVVFETYYKLSKEPRQIPLGCIVPGSLKKYIKNI